MGIFEISVETDLPTALLPSVFTTPTNSVKGNIYIQPHPTAIIKLAGSRLT